MKHVGDHLTYCSRPPFPDSSATDLKAVQESFVLTAETGELCARILQRLASYPSPQRGAFLFTGSPGVGKTHLLRYLESLLADPDSPGWNLIQPYLRSEARPRMKLGALFISVPADPSVDLGGFLLREMSVLSETGDPGADAQELSAADFSSSLKKAAEGYATGSLGFLALEDISRRIDILTDNERLEREIRLYKIASEIFSQKGITVVLVADEEHLKRERGIARPVPVLESLSQFCDFIWLSRNSVVEVISAALAQKTGGQKSAILEILDRLREKLPLLAPKPETFADLYPIHPNVFDALFQVRAVLREFSPLDFARRAIEAACTHPAEQLIGLDALFDHVLPTLRSGDEFRHLIAAYDEFTESVIPQLKTGSQKRAQALLKGITFWTVFASQPATVKALANSLLLYDEAGFVPGYSRVAAILIELEQKGKAYLVAEGDQLDRSYRLLSLLQAASPDMAMDHRAREDDFRLRLPFLIYDWIGRVIPAWQPNMNPKYRRSSQSLVVPATKDPGKAQGMVYFKSLFDPPWGKNDLVALQETPYQWVLLLLSPLERFYEFDSAIREYAFQSAKIMVWHPDVPTAPELEILRSCAETTAPSPKAAEDPEKSRQKAWMVLKELYVKRGKLLTASGHWTVGDELGKRSLAEYLSGQLAAMAAGAGSTPGSLAAASEQSPLERKEDERLALRWAALLSGAPEPGDTDLQAAESSLLSWRVSSMEIDFKALAAKLQTLPESMRTTRFWNEVKFFELYLGSLQPLLQGLSDGEIPFVEAMVKIASLFYREEQRLQRWRRSLENLAALLRWLPAFEHSRDYVCGAFPTPQQDLNDTRARLLEQIEQPHVFLAAAARDAFDRTFLEFKEAYIDYYYSCHEDALQALAGVDKSRSKINAAALRNLELLSGLRYTDKSYLRRVHIMGKWLQRNQCHLPVRRILDRYPRCFCNFNPTGSEHLTDAVERINEVVNTGIEYFRSILRSCKMHVIEGLKTLSVDDHRSKQIAALLSRGKVIPLKPQSVEILNQVIDKHTSDFIRATRAYKA